MDQLPYNREPSRKAPCHFCGKSVTVYKATRGDYDYRECEGDCGRFRVADTVVSRLEIGSVTDADRRAVRGWLEGRTQPHPDDVVSDSLLRRLAEQASG